ncbi:MAG TPA: N-acetylmuramoyl-L-alanine amidase [Gemmatimonadaceae bacterium]
MKLWPTSASAILVALAACTHPRPGNAGGAPTPNTSSAQPSPLSVSLPPIPLVQGALQIRVVYPSPNQLIQARDSNFIFGSVGNGHAKLTIDGAPVQVYPNGSFIAFLPLPARDHTSYDLMATLGADTARVTQPIRLLPAIPVLADTGVLVVDSSSVAPFGRIALRDSEIVRVAVRAPANATVAWRADSVTTVPMVNGAALPLRNAFNAPVAPGVVTPRSADDSTQWSLGVPAGRMRAPSAIVVARGADTVRLPVPAIAPAPLVATWGILGADTSSVSDTDRVIIGRPVPNGTYKWLLMAGTAVPVTGYDGDFVRVRLDDALQIWVRASDIALMPNGWQPPARVAGNAQLRSAAQGVDLEIPMSSRPPFLVEEGDHEIQLTLYGVTGNTDIITYAGDDSLVRVVRWEPVGSERVRYTLRLAAQPFGYLAFWDNGRFVLRVRRPPHIDPDRPLAGLTIAVDPGHPPIGATGPTGLYEPVPTLAVGEKLRDVLQARGATVIMTRTTAAPVALGDRPIMARRADAQALVSIHLNALPDGVDPFVSHGTGTYFFHPQSEPLARALETSLVRRLGLPELGIHYDNLALARPTWMPAVLCEGAFIMMPEQEAALRTPQFQAAYARGIADGLETYFRSLAPHR